MAEMAEGSGSVEVTGELPKSPDKAVITQHTVTVIKTSEAEQRRTVESVVVTKHTDGKMNGVDDNLSAGAESTLNDTEPEGKEDMHKVSDRTKTLNESASGADDKNAYSAGAMSEPGNAEPEASGNMAAVSETNEQSKEPEPGVDDTGTDEEVMVNWVPRPLTQDEIDSVVKDYANMPNHKLQKFLEFFWSVDQKRHGYFTINEFSRVMRSRKKKITDKEIAKIFSDIDLDSDMVVTLDEFLEEMSKKRWRDLSKEDLKPIFDDIDVNKDGFVCINDMLAWFPVYDVPGTLPDAAKNALINEIKRTTDKRIDLDCFVKIVKIYCGFNRR